MAKTGLTLDKLDLLVPEGKTWSICLGAGCSLPIFPTWGDLAQEILQSTCAISKKMASTISQYLSPDIIIQSAYDKSQLEATKFAEHLSSSLYHKILNNLSSLDKKEIIKCLSSTHPDPNRKWVKFIEVVTQYGEPSAMQVARIITEAYVKNKGLESILSFNAEVLLGSLVNAIMQIEHKHNTKILDYITEPTSSHYKGRISYIFCHGSVAIPESSRVAQKQFNSLDKLVFSENEYLQLANSSYSWQSSRFINTLTTNTVFFVGLSFKDQNIRRWLAWIHECRKRAINKFNNQHNCTAHYWIEKVPNDKGVKTWIESSVAHLGIRMIWISDWNEIEQVFRKAIKL